MPKWGTQDYKNAVFQQLSQGSGSGPSGGDEDHFQHFENFSAGAPRRDVEAGVHPSERAEIAEDLMGELQQRGLAPSWLQKMLGLGSSDPRTADPDDLAKLAEYSRQNHPEVFQRVMADKPFLVRWLDKPLVAALVGVIAGKLINRAYDRD